MNVWIDILHIPQLNFYKPFIGMLSERGHNVYITVLNRGKLSVIAKKELADIPNVSISVVGKHRMKKWSVILEANLLRLPQLLCWAMGKHIDVAFSNGSHIGIVSQLYKFPAYEFEDDPQAADYHLMVRYATQNHSIIYEATSQLDIEPKDKVLPVLKEWAYLNPKLFIPDVRSLREYAIEAHNYLFLREVSVGTLNYAEQKSGAILSIVPEIQKVQALHPELKVLLSLEEKYRRAEYPVDWILLQEPIKDIHSLIYYSAGLISSGDSMAREAALLGVPAYYLGIRYDMPANAAAAKVAQLQNQKTQPIADWLHDILSVDIQTAEEKQQQLRKHIDKEFIDINKYMLRLVESVANPICAKYAQVRKE